MILQADRIIYGDSHTAPGANALLVKEGRIAAIAPLSELQAAHPDEEVVRYEGATLLPGLEMDGAHIVVNRRQETSVPGCYAAGDCTGRPYQLTKAVGEGNVAAHEMLERMES